MDNLHAARNGFSFAKMFWGDQIICFTWLLLYFALDRAGFQPQNIDHVLSVTSFATLAYLSLTKDTELSILFERVCSGLFTVVFVSALTNPSINNDLVIMAVFGVLSCAFLIAYSTSVIHDGSVLNISKYFEPVIISLIVRFLMCFLTMVFWPIPF